jgi:hypothetical protein
LTACTNEIILDFPYDYFSQDIAIHPDGTFYIINHLYGLIHVDLTVGVIEEITFPVLYKDYNGLVSDIEGNLYMVGRRLDRYNIKTRNFSHLGVLPDDYVGAGDITVRDGVYYMSATSAIHKHSAILKLDITDASKSQVLFTGDGIKYNFQSMATIYDGCGQSVTYGWGDDDNLYEIDFTTGNVTSICYPLGFIGYGGTSYSEFLASDAECDLLLDLDRDNSSGVYPYDFDNKSIRCNPNQSTHIVDDDIYLHTAADLDSIVITLSGNTDGTQEMLSVSQSEPGVSLTYDDGRYLLVLTGNRSDTT